MTFRLCLFGNSHLAALRDAWADHPNRWPGVAPQFIGAHRNYLLDTQVRGTRLWPTTPEAAERFRRLGGVESVDLAAFDGFVIAGAQTGVTPAVMVWRDMRWVGLPSLLACDDLATMPPLLVSESAARDSIAERLTARLGITFARRLRAATDKPIWITAQPRPSAAILSAPRPKTLRLTDAISSGDGPALSTLSDKAAHLACAQAGVTFIAQPAQTVQDGLLTALPYVTGANRLAAVPGLPQPPDDVDHANSAYGAMMLDAVAAAISAGQTP